MPFRDDDRTKTDDPISQEGSEAKKDGERRERMQRRDRMRHFTPPDQFSYDIIISQFSCNVIIS